MVFVGDFSVLILVVVDFFREVFKGVKENKKVKEKSSNSEVLSFRLIIVGDRNSVFVDDVVFILVSIILFSFFY